MRFAFAKCAEAKFTTQDTLINGKKHFHHRIEGYTTGLIGKAWPLLDIYHSYTDPKTDLPVRAIRDVVEQKYKDYKVDLYDRSSRSDSAILIRETGDTVIVPRNTHDLVSVAYYVRNQLSTMKLTTKSRIEIPTFFNGEFYPLQIRYVGLETVKTQFGKVECYRFIPIVRKGSLFEDQEAITVFISTDDNHLPVRVQFKLFLGSMYCDLVGYRGLASPFYIVQ